MFGYIVPVKPELKVREFDAFKACYCGLCRVIGANYGLAARMFLNYDFVFLAMLLWPPEASLETARGRCIGCPFRKKEYCCENPALKKAAGLGVILTWWKLMDGAADEGFAKGLGYRALSLLLRRAYKKASSEYPEYDSAVKNGIMSLTELERGKCNSLDRPADCFAKMLSAAADGENGSRQRILNQILYHTGRWIYIIDACDDLQKDMKSGSYNPVAERFSVNGELDDVMRARLETTLLHSRNLAGNAFELLESSVWSGVIRNIIFLGMPAVCSAVLSGKWRRARRGAPK